MPFVRVGWGLLHLRGENRSRYAGGCQACTEDLDRLVELAIAFRLFNWDFAPDTL